MWLAGFILFVMSIMTWIFKKFVVDTERDIFCIVIYIFFMVMCLLTILKSLKV
jgi:hypothetical protein